MTSIVVVCGSGVVVGRNNFGFFERLKLLVIHDVNVWVAGDCSYDPVAESKHVVRGWVLDEEAP